MKGRNPPAPARAPSDRNLMGFHTKVARIRFKQGIKRPRFADKLTNLSTLSASERGEKWPNRTFRNPKKARDASGCVGLLRPPH